MTDINTHLVSKVLLHSKYKNLQEGIKKKKTTLKHGILYLHNSLHLVSISVPWGMDSVNIIS